ncbi:MAG: hypothetical protein RBT11_18630 [Desulfobacterales bacterium]|jgi:hypothetical protein|nr:hypothetical protein [Desulfobacterales bacterium]
MNKFQRIALAERDLNIRKLSKILGRTEPHVSNVLAGRYKSYVLRERIALALGKTESHLWPKQDQ